MAGSTTAVPIEFYKVTELPEQCASNALYFVKSGGVAETYVTDSNGNPYPAGNTSMIRAVVQSTDLNGGFF